MNPLQRAFEDIGQRDFDDTELSPVVFIWCPDGVGRWTRKPLDYENAADRAARKTAELLAKQGPQPLYHGFRDPPEPAPSFWRPKLDQMGVWSAYATAAFCVVCLVILFT